MMAFPTAGAVSVDDGIPMNGEVTVGDGIPMADRDFSG